jgi:PleD family two-component response regulator
LTLVRSLVALHGGSVEARSEGLGHGSEFIVYLPASDAPTRLVLPESRGARQMVTKRPRPMLVVDDDQDDANRLAMLLAGLGVEVKVAYDGPKALELCRDWTPELVFLDLELPGINGF